MSVPDITIKYYGRMGCIATQPTNADQRRLNPCVYWMMGHGATPQQALAQLVEDPVYLTASGDPYWPTPKEAQK